MHEHEEEHDRMPAPAGTPGFVDGVQGPRQPAGMSRWTWLLLAGWWLLPAAARAEDVLSAVPAVHAACESARGRDPSASSVYVLEVEYRLGTYHPEPGRLFVDTRRNLRALDGHVSVMLSGLEPIAFEATEEQAAALRAAAQGGAKLRLGFFLGFDQPNRPPCVVRSVHGVTIVRADLAFAELVREGERLARVETDRLRAWLDDQQELAIPGEGPRGTVGAASFDNAQPPPESWQRALQSAGIRARIAQCHAEGIARGAEPEGQVVVRLDVESRTGRVRRADVAISALGDAAEGECIARALGAGAQLPPGLSSWPEVVDLSVPVRLTTR